MNQFSSEDQLSYKARRHSPRHRALLRVSGLLMIGTIAAACGSSTTGATTSTAAAGGTGTAATTTAVNATSNAKLGTILVNSKGFTLYRLSKDSMNKSVCTSACAAVWPPLLMTGSGSPVAGSGVTGLGSIPAAGGARQVTYNGMPLYTFTGDNSAGQVNGQDLTDTWGTWFVLVTKASTAPTTTAPAGVTTTTSGGGGGVGF
jgi:predicted lipoprotein with Yx(FWY)xxD motif